MATLHLASLNYIDRVRRFKIQSNTKLHIHSMSENPYTSELIKYSTFVFFQKPRSKVPHRLYTYLILIMIFLNVWLNITHNLRQLLVFLRIRECSNMQFFRRLCHPSPTQFMSWGLFDWPIENSSFTELLFSINLDNLGQNFRV